MNTTQNQPPDIQAPAGYVMLEQLRAQTGIKRKTVEARLLALGVSTFSHPQDRRRRMVRAEDAAKLTSPQEVTHRTPRAAHTGR
jgi:hypothetical protein